MRNTKGYILLEMLAALSVCCLIVLSVFPMVQQLSMDRYNTRLRTLAFHLLYEQLGEYSIGNVPPAESTRVINGRQYKIYWKKNAEFSGMVEGCVDYETGTGETRTICDSVK